MTNWSQIINTASCTIHSSRTAVKRLMKNTGHMGSNASTFLVKWFGLALQATFRHRVSVVVIECYCIVATVSWW